MSKIANYRITTVNYQGLVNSFELINVETVTVLIRLLEMYRISSGGSVTVYCMGTARSVTTGLDKVTISEVHSLAYPY